MSGFEGLDSLDRKILEEVQSSFPVCGRPFAELARKIGTDEGELIERLRSLKERRVIRRFGAVFDSRRLGYVSTLVGVRIPDESRIPAVAEEVSRYMEVTHNYQRSDRFNLWFTLIAASRERIGQIIERIGSLPGVAEIHDLPAEDLYKIKVSFRTSGQDERKEDGD